MKTPVAERAAGRKKLAARGQALPDGTAPVPDLAYLKKAIRAKGRVSPAKWPALKKLIVKRARQLGATGATGVKGTWAFQAANDARAVELAGAGTTYRYRHGWILNGVSADDAPEEKADKMSGNAFRRGDGTQEALQGHRDAARAHRAAAQLSSSPARSAYHARMAVLHSRVAGLRMTSNRADDQAHVLGQGVRNLAGGAPAVELTGDGHGRHVAGTEDVYSHGWEPRSGSTLGADGIRRPAKGGAPAGAAGSPAKPRLVATGRPYVPGSGDSGGILSGPHPADRLTVASDKGATARAMTSADLSSADRELARRAALLGKPGQLSKAHKAARAELAARSGAKGTPARARPAAPAAGIGAILAHPVGADVKKDTAPLFEGDYGDGFSVKVDSASIIHTPAEGKVAEVNASVYKDGRKVGVVVRGLTGGQDGTKVLNTEMLLSPKYQGQGFASDFYKQTEARLKAAGVQSAHLRANNDVGGYAWARKGFDWASPQEGKALIADLAARYGKQPSPDVSVTREIKSLMARAKDPASARFPTPYDLSRVGYTPGASTWPGKQFLLGRSWNGTKKL